jgi:hypothetical protein
MLRKHCKLAGIAAVAVISIAVWAYGRSGKATRDSDLLSVATEKKHLKHDENWESYYQWQSDNSIVMWTREQGAPLGTVIDLASGSAKPLTGLQTLMSQRPGASKRGMKLSPQGDVVAWVEGSFTSQATSWYAATLNGKLLAHGDLLGMAYGIDTWMPDGKTWLALGATYDHPFVIRHSLTATTGTATELTKTLFDRIAAQSSSPPNIEGATADGQAVTIQMPQETIKSVRVYRYNISQPNNPAEKWALPLPAGARPIECVASSDCRLLAYVLYFHPAPDAESRIPATNTAEIWISDLKGHDMHPLGSLPVSPLADDQQRGLDFPSNLQWSPSGRQLSFILKETLYTLPVP